MTGAERARQVIERHPKLRVILATGYDELPGGENWAGTFVETVHSGAIKQRCGIGPCTQPLAVFRHQSTWDVAHQLGPTRLRLTLTWEERGDENFSGVPGVAAPAAV
jgi:hypothetical protein